MMSLVAVGAFCVHFLSGFVLGEAVLRFVLSRALTAHCRTVSSGAVVTELLATEATYGLAAEGASVDTPTAAQVQGARERPGEGANHLAGLRAVACLATVRCDDVGVT